MNNVEYIPVIGFIWMAIRTMSEQHACLASDPFGPVCDAEWVTFGRFNVSMIVTVVSLFVALIILRLKRSK